VLESAALRGVLSGVEQPRRRILRFFGPSESAVARVVEEAGGQADGLEITICAQDLEIRVDLIERRGGEARAERIDGALREGFAGDLFVEDDRPIAALVLERCRALGLRLATAESCTGGLVGARLTEVAGSSDVYVGGVIAYSDAVKERRLGVPTSTLGRHGAVSAETAQAMAAGARAELGADAAIAVTGIAGPEGGTPGKPVGLVYVTAQAPGSSSTERLLLPGDREAVRSRAAAQSLHSMRRVL
jgi:nicotinamide-nucleotide amidase